MFKRIKLGLLVLLVLFGTIASLLLGLISHSVLAESAGTTSLDVGAVFSWSSVETPCPPPSAGTCYQTTLNLTQAPTLSGRYTIDTANLLSAPVTSNRQSGTNIMLFFNNVPTIDSSFRTETGALPVESAHCNVNIQIEIDPDTPDYGIVTLSPGSTKPCNDATITTLAGNSNNGAVDVQIKVPIGGTFHKDIDYTPVTTRPPTITDTPPTDTGGSKDGKCENGGTVLGVIPKDPLRWLSCGIASLLANVIDGLNRSVETLLYFSPIDADAEAGKTHNVLKSVWESILVPANILFVIAFLVMIISTALDLGVFSNYTVKKLLPRIIIAAILANLSWYICGSLIQVTNTIGGAVKEVVLAPVVKITDINPVTKEHVLDAATHAAAYTGLQASGAGAFQTAVITGLGTLIVVVFATGAGVAFLLPIIIGVFIAIVIALLALLVRRILILLLIIFAPLAFALWALPGGEKWMKRWWKLFTEMLLMYPMILALFASGIFVSILISKGNTGQDLATSAMSFVALVLPYFVLPTIFKLASGTLATITGAVNDKSKGMLDRSKKYRNQKMRLGYERNVQPRQLQTRSNMAGWLQDKSSSSGFVGKRLLRGSARVIGGYNVEASMSARTAQDKKVIDDQIATGRDDEIRGLTVNKAAVNSGNTAKWVQQADGSMGWDRDVSSADTLARVDANGKRQYKSLGGAWVDEAHVDAGHKRWGKNQFAKQAALSYEMRKAMTNTEMTGLTDRYASLAQGTWGMSDRQAGGIWTGAGFENQNSNLEYKYMKYETDQSTGKKQMRFDSQGFAKEAYEKRGSYPLAQMGANTFDRLTEAYDTASAAGDVNTMRMIAGTAETFMQRGSLPGAQIGNAGAEGAQTPVNAPGALGGGERSQVYASGAAHVNESILRLAKHTGVYDNPPAPVPTPPPPAGPPQAPRPPQQK